MYVLQVFAMSIEFLRSVDESSVVKRVCTPLCTLWLFLIYEVCYHLPCSCLLKVDPEWMVEGQATKGWNHDCLDSQMGGCHANQGSLHFRLS